MGFDLRYGARVTRCTWDGPHQFPGAGRRDTDKWGARLVWTWMRGLHKQDGQSPPTPPPNKAPPPPLQQSSQGMKVPPHEITAVKDEKCDGSSSDSWRKVSQRLLAPAQRLPTLAQLLRTARVLNG